MMGRVKGTVSLLFPHPRLLVTQRDLCGEHGHGIINKCSEKASISMSLLFIDIDCYFVFISSSYTRTLFTDPIR